jgi:hypothetical protein
MYSTAHRLVPRIFGRPAQGVSLFKRIAIAAAAAMLAMPAHAQYAPPPVPQWNCDEALAPWDQFSEVAKMTTIGAGRIATFTTAMQARMQGCQQRYQIEVQRRQMEMQRVEMLNRQRYGN